LENSLRKVSQKDKFVNYKVVNRVYHFYFIFSVSKIRNSRLAKCKAA
jgi:hypothetical protein